MANVLLKQQKNFFVNIKACCQGDSMEPAALQFKEGFQFVCLVFLNIQLNLFLKGKIMRELGLSIL